MVRLLPRSIRHLLVCAGALGILLGHAPSQAADDASLWQNVQKAGVLRCGAAVAAPYVMRNAGSGQYSGYFVDLCRNFGEKVLKVRVEFVDTNWDNLVAGLQSGKWDLAMALNQTPERALAVSSRTSDRLPGVAGGQQGKPQVQRGRQRHRRLRQARCDLCGDVRHSPG